MSRTLMAAVQVQLTPREITAGDTFQLRLSGDGRLDEATFDFSSAYSIVGQSSQMSSINGRVSRSISYTIAPLREEDCTLTALSIPDDDGKLQPVPLPRANTVTVKKLEPDPAVKFTYVTDPAEVMVGDSFHVVLEVSVPAVDYQGRFIPPFLEQDFFSNVSARHPAISLTTQLPDDAPLRREEVRPVQDMKLQQGRAIYSYRIPFRAQRVGSYTFPAPVIRDERITGLSPSGQFSRARCVSIGSPLTVAILPPPEKDRPSNFSGAIGTDFDVTVTFDTLEAKVGDPLTLTLTCKTDGSADLIQPPLLPKLPAFRIYGEPNRSQKERTVDFVYHLRPLKAGLLTLPPLSVAWFDRASKSYKQASTTILPIRVLPSAQLVLLDADGTASTTILPGPLQFTRGNVPLWRPRLWSLCLLGLALLLLALKLIWRPARQLLRHVLNPIRRRRPAARAVAALAAAKTTAEALDAIRTWLQAPSLTARELQTRLPDHPAKPDFVAAFVALEESQYSQGGSLDPARQTLQQLLPQLDKARRHRGHGASKALLLVGLLMVWPMQSRADDFLRSQADAAAAHSTEARDYARSANLYLKLLRAGQGDESVYLNAAACAFLAHRPVEARTLTRQAQQWYGLSPHTAALNAAICAQLNVPVPTPFFSRLPLAVWTTAHCTFLALLLLSLLFVRRKGRTWLLPGVFLFALLLISVYLLRVSTERFPADLPLEETQP